MNKQVQAVRGMNDILPDEILYWQAIETKLSEIMSRYAYQEIRFPIIEDTSLFVRSVGEATDIVEKETYTFNDRNNDSLTLRPEGTAGCVRALVQHNILRNQPTQRLWYIGPMFRHERPQKGRYRQFHQFGVEVYGIAEVDITVELLLICARLWRALGIDAHIKLQLNSLGSPICRQAYQESLVAYFTAHFEKLDADSQRRLQKNPLRILDSKNPALVELIQQAPKITDYLDVESNEQFTRLRAGLEYVGLAYELNPRLVRGLDYYTGVVFEWVTDGLGAQGAVCAGGRYDNLVEQLGGPATPAVGFAMGLERLVLLLKEYQPLTGFQIDACLLSLGTSAEKQALALAEMLRTALPTLHLLTYCGDGSFKSQFKKADKSGANIALVLGEEEAEKQQITIKYLREQRDQITIPQAEMVELLQAHLQK